MTLEGTGVTTLKRYTKPSFTRISTTQVLLDLLEQAQQDKRLADHLRASIHQAEPEYGES